MLVDGHSMAFRAFYALPAETLRTTTGVATNAVYGFTSMIVRLLEAEQPTHMAVAFDLPGGTFRSEQLPSYKEGRAPTPPDLIAQIPVIESMLDALRIARVSKPRYEADDVIATLATMATKAGWRVLILSGDRDALQLVSDNTTVLYPIKGVSEMARMTPSAVSAKYGVCPAQYPDLAALVGEKADNLPGVPGVGPKTAAKWISQYGTLTDLLTHAEKVGGKVGESLRAHLDNVRSNRRLNQLVTDLELGVGLTDLTVTGFDVDAVRQLATELQFSGLRERILAANPASVAEPTTTLADAHTDTDLAVFLAAADGPIAIDVAGSARPGAPDAWGVGLASTTRMIGLELTSLDVHQETLLAQFLASPSPKIVHGLKATLHMLRARGLKLAGVVLDTELAAYLCWPDRRKYLLEDLTAELAGIQICTDDQLTLDIDGTNDAGASRALGIAQLAAPMESALQRAQAHNLLTDIELPLAGVLAQMEATGIGADEDFFIGLEKRFASQVDGAAQAAYEAIGRTVNLASPKQLQEVLFDQLGMPRTKKTKTGYTTDAAALAWLYEQTGHPFLEHLLAHRDAMRMRVTVEGLLRAIGDDGRIHTTFQQTIAATGRLSSTDPNLQNIPNRTEVGRLIRQGFVVGAGYETLFTADYSQIEMRIMAHLSGDEELIAAFNSGEDLHRYVASRVYGIDPSAVSHDDRSRIKAMTFGLAYGLSEFGLAQQLGLKRSEASELITDYFSRFGKVRDYLHAVVVDATKTGYTETMFGRRRYLPDLGSTNRQLRENAERAALNSPIQGSAADIIKIAMIDLANQLRLRQLSSRICLQIHDELVLEVAPGELAEVTAVVKQTMAQAATLAVPLDVSIGVGTSWLAAGH